MPTEVAIKNFDEPSLVASNLIQTLEYKNRSVKLIIQAERSVFEKVLIRPIPLIAGDDYSAKLQK